ncbi:MAG: pectin acetylesterase [Lachnospiraceae bacterium]|nr:pectin acetylesterase [Lachnospiraceae bacterium]
MSERNRDPFQVKLGNAVEVALDREISRRFEAPLLKGKPVPSKWYRVPVKKGISGDGSEYHIYIKRGTSENMCVFLSGGGVVWNEYTAARPATGGRIAAGLPNFYWNNLRPLTQIMNIGYGLTETGNPRNPFDSWNFIIITYATGDFHIGDGVFPYKGEDGQEHTLNFHGYGNFLAGMEAGRKYFGKQEKLLIAGESAGAFAVPALAGEIAEDHFPECRDVTLLSDSALLLYDGWRRTAKEVWHAPKKFRHRITSPNLALGWYMTLYRKYGERFRYLYAGSPRDYLLSAYYNDVTNKTFTTDADVQKEFEAQLKEMLKEFRRLTPSFSFYIYNFRNMKRMYGKNSAGTVHTIVRRPQFHRRNREGITMAEWLRDAVRA